VEGTSARSRLRPQWGAAQLGFVAIPLVVLALDQLTKWAVRGGVDRGDEWLDLGLVRIIHVTNSGAAFGLFQGSGLLLAMTSVVGIAAILIYLFNPGFAHPLMRVGLALMLGGAAGNLIDRLKDGRVVDFIKVPHWPAFNVADSAITIGVLLLVWALLREPAKNAG
jgi:signal peptidase II